MKRLLERARLYLESLYSYDAERDLYTCDECLAPRGEKHIYGCDSGTILRDLDAAIEADPLGKAVELLRDAHLLATMVKEDAMRNRIDAFLADIDKQTGPEAQGSNERSET